MEGRIKFIDAKIQKWGFIVPSDKSADVHFEIADFIGPSPSTVDKDAPVQFDLVERGANRDAKHIKLLVPPTAVAPKLAMNRTGNVGDRIH